MSDMIAYCGLDCGECNAYKTTRTRDLEKRSRWLDSGVTAQKSSSRQRISIVMDAGQTGFRVGAAKYARFGLALNSEKSRLVVTAVNTLAGNLGSFLQTSLWQSRILKAFEKYFSHSRGD